jgi:serine/threonine protein kinase
MSGGPSTLVIQADGLGEENKSKVKEALCYMSPEQTGSMETTTDDHRTDLYSLGIMFWTLLVGRGMLPFEGGPLDILHSTAQKRPMPVHEVRRDVPQVLAQIIEKACRDKCLELHVVDVKHRISFSPRILIRAIKVHMD